MQDKTTNNWVMVSFPHDFDHHKADQLVHEAVMESGLAEVGIESIGEFDDDNPIFYLEFKTRGPGRDWVMNTLSRHAYVQGITGVSSIPPSPIRGDSTVPPPPAGPESIPPIRLDPPMPLHALFPPKIEEPEEELPDLKTPLVPAFEEPPSLVSRTLSSLGLGITLVAPGTGILFLTGNDGVIPFWVVSGISTAAAIAYFIFKKN